VPCPAEAETCHGSSPWEVSAWDGFDTDPAVWFAALLFFKFPWVSYHLFEEIRFIC